MFRLCPTCNQTVEATAYTTHRQQHDKARGSWSEGRDRTAQHKFRILVLARAGYRCQHIEDGQRCSVIRPLQAHHLEPGNDDPTKGVALCRDHHRTVDSHAR